MKDKILKLQGVVTESLGNVQFKVTTQQDEREFSLRCYLAGKMKLNRIKVLVGDRVDIEIPVSKNLENSIGRIVFRTKI